MQQTHAQQIRKLPQIYWHQDIMWVLSNKVLKTYWLIYVTFMLPYAFLPLSRHFRIETAQIVLVETIVFWKCKIWKASSVLFNFFSRICQKVSRNVDMGVILLQESIKTLHPIVLQQGLLYGNARNKTLACQKAIKWWIFDDLFHIERPFLG